jgi:hypothetical protein
MKKLTALFLLLIVSLPVLAVEDGQVMYIGGSAPGVTAGTVGHLDTTADAALIFEYAGSKLAIPYADIQSYQYSTEVTRHLGVLPAIAVGMFRMRQHSHFFRVSYRGADGVAQVAVFEVSKQTPRTLQAVLTVRAPKPKLCSPCAEN